MSFNRQIIVPFLLFYLPSVPPGPRGTAKTTRTMRRRAKVAPCRYFAKNFYPMTEEPRASLHLRAELGVSLPPVSVRTGEGAHPLCGGTVGSRRRDGLHVGTGLASGHHSFGLGPAKGKWGLTHFILISLLEFP